MDKKPHSPKIFKRNGIINIANFNKLETDKKEKFYEALKITKSEKKLIEDRLMFQEKHLSMRIACKIFYDNHLDLGLIPHNNYSVLDFKNIKSITGQYLTFLEQHKDKIINILMSYETFYTAIDEFNRAINYLENININRDYFINRVPPIASFLPINQPFYSIFLFGIIPSLMAEKIFIKPPSIAFNLYETLIKSIELEHWFNNIEICNIKREEFVKKTKNIVRSVIFTGSSTNIDKIRRMYPYDVLFIANGTGHNPILISENANIQKALETTLRTVLYNQGQDCAAPKSIVIHSKKTKEFCSKLIKELKEVEKYCGDFSNKETIIGPNIKDDHIIEIAKKFQTLREFHIYGGNINHVSKIIYPSVFRKPLMTGANYYEFFAPVFFIQEYSNEQELDIYFLSEEYLNNAMYISVFGDTTYTDKLIQIGIHDEENVLVNTDLHIIEKGYMPYGGNGRYSSPIFHLNERLNSSILIPRELYNFFVNKNFKTYHK